MEGSFPRGALDGGETMVPYEVLAPHQCAVCRSTTRLLRCSGCKVVSYCGAEHQYAHRSKHKAACNTIKEAQEALEREEAALRARPSSLMLPEDVFNNGVGHFWGILDTRDYMSARFGAAKALLEIHTVAAVEASLAHMQDMLRLCRRDNMGIRDHVPHLLLRLGREQECYDFVKWWATLDGNGQYDFGNTTLPYLNIRGANTFEPMFPLNDLSLSHLVALTLLKLRLYLDFSSRENAVHDSFGSGFGFSGYDSVIDRPLGKLARAKLRTMNERNFDGMMKTLKKQYLKLVGVVNERNSYLWETLISNETPFLPEHYSRGSCEEADLVVLQCQQAWEESEDAIIMIDADTATFTRVYEDSSNTGNSAAADISGSATGQNGSAEMKRTRGTGKAFPSVFNPHPATPAELFLSIATANSTITRFTSRHDQRKLLVYTDGACANNGQSDPRAAWAVVCGAPMSGQPSVFSGRLENTGPFGDTNVATSNRAELRAAIAALRLYDWRAEGYSCIVIATDSSYTVDGATGWTKGWVRNGWKTRNGGDVKNRDLWELLLGEVERWDDTGLRVEFWHIPRDLNGEADKAAKQAAANGEALVEFTDVATTSSIQCAIGGIKQARHILALCLENESLFEACFPDLVKDLASRSKVERATTSEAALTKLSQRPAPDVILIADGALTRQKKVWERVIDRLRGGTTVVLAGCFSSMVNEGEFTRFFGRLGLPWKRGSYNRETVTLQRGAVSGELADKLPSLYSQKALFVQNVERTAIWYARERSQEAAVVFARVGSGNLGYIGDVNGEESSNKTVLAMCGLLA